MPLIQLAELLSSDGSHSPTARAFISEDNLMTPSACILLPKISRSLILGASTTLIIAQATGGPPRPEQIGLPSATIISAEAPPPLPGESAIQIESDQVKPTSFTLATLEEIALRQNPTLEGATALVVQQQGMQQQSTLYPNPTAGYVRSDPNQSGQSRTQGVFVSQDIVTAGKRRLAREAGQQEIEWRKWQVDAQRQRITNDVRIRYYDLLGAQEMVKATKELEHLASKGVESAKGLFQGKQSARLDVIQSEIQLNIVKSVLDESISREQLARQQLANVVGDPSVAQSEFPDSLEGVFPDLEFNSSLENLYATSPLIKSQEWLIQAAATDVRLAKVEAVPNVNVQIVADRDSVQNYNNLSSLVAMPVPVFNRNQGNIRSAVGLQRQQIAELARLKLAMRDQLAVAFQQYKASQAQTQRFEKEIVPKAKENLNLVTRGYELGEFDVLRVINARQTYFEVRLALIDSWITAKRAVVEIEGLGLTGGLNPTEIGTALQAQGAAGGGRRSVLLQQLQQRGVEGSSNLPGVLQGGAR